jgi:hypothetical protein
MEPIRIAMWSGPRNISTAMMRSWENRGDAAVSDEPLYAHYLKETRVDHPGRDEIIAACETDWRKVVAYLTGPVPGGKAVWYQKHMTHHLLPGIERGWVKGLTNAFLIREPTEMITSLAKVTPNPRIEDTGLPQQAALFEQVREWEGKTPPVVDARDVLTDPRRMLGLLCEALGVAFTERMLAWPAGKRATDGVWAPHWYASVEKSTGFEGYRPKNEPVPERLKTVHDECEGLYRKLWRERLGR